MAKRRTSNASEHTIQQKEGPVTERSRTELQWPTFSAETSAISAGREAFVEWRESLLRKLCPKAISVPNPNPRNRKCRCLANQGQAASGSHGGTWGEGEELTKAAVCASWQETGLSRAGVGGKLINVSGEKTLLEIDRPTMGASGRTTLRPQLPGTRSTGRELQQRKAAAGRSPDRPEFRRKGFISWLRPVSRARRLCRCRWRRAP